MNLGSQVPDLGISLWARSVLIAEVRLSPARGSHSPALLKDVRVVPEQHRRVPVIPDRGLRHSADARPPASPAPRAGAVDPLVRVDRELPLEAHATLGAGEGPLVRVHALVADQQRRVGEAATAVCTHVAPLAGLRAPAGPRGWRRRRT